MRTCLSPFSCIEREAHIHSIRHSVHKSLAHIHAPLKWISCTIFAFLMPKYSIMHAKACFFKSSVKRSFWLVSRTSWQKLGRHNQHGLQYRQHLHFHCSLARSQHTAFNEKTATCYGKYDIAAECPLTGSTVCGSEHFFFFVRQKKKWEEEKKSRIWKEKLAFFFSSRADIWRARVYISILKCSNRSKYSAKVRHTHF